MNSKLLIISRAVKIPELKAKRLRWLLMLSSVTFVFGIFLPMLTISKFILFKSSFSILSGVVELLRNGQFILFVVVAAFSILLPIMKIHVLYLILSKKKPNKKKLQHYLELMHKYGRWAMLDVMVVAILLVTVKLGAVASVKVHLGLFVFGFAVLLIMFITSQVMRLTSTSDELSDEENQ